MKKQKARKNPMRTCLCYLLVMAMLFTGVNVSAAAFEAPSEEFAGDLFTSGPAETPGVTETPDSTAPSAGEIEIFEDGVSTEMPTPSKAPSGAPEEPGDSNLIQNGDPLRIIFADKTGDAFYETLEIQTKVGETVELPQVPGYEGAEGSGWKWDLEDSDEMKLEAGEELTVKPEELLAEYVMNGMLILYAVQGQPMCTVTFYNNSGTAFFKGGQIKVAEGSTLSLPDFPNSKYKNFGWTTVKSGRTVQYEIGEKITVRTNMNFYMIRYAVSKVRTLNFRNPNGSANSQFYALEQSVLTGTKVKLPKVPVVTGYTALGWSTKKNASEAKYLEGQTVTITKNMTLYAVRKKVPTYSVTFNNNSGTSKSKVYTSLNCKVSKNAYMVLPEVPKAKGYQNIGWTTTLKGSKPLYKEGSKVKVTKSMKFYAVRKKSAYYTVNFYLGNGSSNSTYKKLSKKVEQGTTITLPEVPERSGYLNLGWSTKKGSSSVTNREETKYQVTKNISFYAVQIESVTVTLHQNNGAIYKELRVGKGNSLILPGVSNKQNYTMMGWSTKSSQSVNPEYEVGETLKINENLHLYAVVFNRSNEREITADDLAQPDLRKYKQVIFVGDSRTRRMQTTLSNQFGSSITQGISYVCLDGAGLSWLKSEGYMKLMELVKDGSNSILQKKTAVIFNFGINDLYNSSNYISYMNSLASVLQKKGCKLFYMSVNPVNDKMIQASGKTSRPEKEVRAFNSAIQSGLCNGGNYTYIDMYSYLMQTGFGTDASVNGVDSGTDDGLHYTTKTYKRIYQQCINVVNKA